MEKIAVVTGASSGIGAEIARGLARADWRCVLIARREDRLRALAEETGGEIEVCDVADRAAVEATAARVLERHPQIGLLVNNAGIAGRASFLDADPSVIEEVIRVNYLGGIWVLRAFLPGLRAAAPSDVVNIVSVSGVVAGPPSGPYSASKHAQLAFSRTVAAELRPEGIRVHTVKPGLIVCTRMPRRRSWTAVAREKASCACFDAEYGPEGGNATSPATETMLTTSEGAAATSPGRKARRHHTPPR